MSVKRTMLLALCATAVLVASASAAQAAAPRWYLKESGSFVGFGMERFNGLVEAMPQETIASQGELSITSNSPSGNLRPISECVSRNTQLIEDPANTESPGTGQMESFEAVCEKETGGLNAAAPPPCTRLGEPFELKLGGGHWTGALEGGKQSGGGSKIYELFADANIEVECLVTKERGNYTGILKAQVLIGKWKLLGPTSGTFSLVGGSGPVFTLKGADFITPTVTKYTEVRADVK